MAPSGHGRLLVITNWRDRKHPRAGGAELVCEELAAYFADNGWQVVILAAAVDGQPADEDLGEGGRLIRRGTAQSVYFWALRWLFAHRRQVSAVIDSQNGIPFFTPLVLSQRTPVLLMVHHVHQDQFAMHMNRALATVGKLLEGPATRWVYGRRALLTASATTRQQVRQRLGLKGDITVAPPGTDGPAHIGTPRSKHESIVCVGRLVAHKQVDLVIEAMPALLDLFPYLQLDIIGDGPSRPYLERRVDALGLSGSVSLHGAVPAAQRDQIVSASWLAVATSAAEGWCLTVIEANTFGVPVVGLRRPGLSNSIRHGETGWLVDDAADLVPAIAAALAELGDPAVAWEWADRARTWASHFTWEEMGRRAARALGAEEKRLNHKGSERRDLSDVASVVYIPGSVGNSTVMRFRASDQIHRTRAGTVLLLSGADLNSAKVAVVRAGLSPLLAADPSVLYEVARQDDFVWPSRLAVAQDTAHAQDRKAA